jgi:hypothetical protein
VIALATWERLPKVFPFQAKPLSSTITLSSLPLHSRTSSAPVEANSVPPRWLAVVERTSGEINRTALRSANNAQRGFIEIAKCGRLTPISQNPQEQPARQVSSGKVFSIKDSSEKLSAD